MPTAARPTRPLLTLALVASLLAASAPIGAHAATIGDPNGTWAMALVPPWVSTRDQWPAETVADSARPAAGAAFAAEDPASSDAIARTPSNVHLPKAVAGAKVAQGSSGAASHSTSYKGRNHLWIPALGINRSVTFYSCSSTSYPGNRVYRWGCAGANNVYLFGHAHSVFKALHDAYVRGRLTRGMKAYYANASGKVATFAVSWWKVTTPDNGAWAYAGQSSPSLTLQTCVGSQSQYRLIVRLRQVG